MLAAALPASGFTNTAAAQSDQQPTHAELVQRWAEAATDAQLKEMKTNLRLNADQEKLWEHLLAGDITTVGSDHSPSPPSMKQNANFFKVWGGISSVQHTLSLMLTEAHVHRQAPLPLIAALVSQRVVERFKLPGTKGQIAMGCDADLVLVDLEREFQVKLEDLFYRHRHTPYVGRKLHGRVVRTVARGRTVFKDGQTGIKPLGRLVKPLR